MAGSRLEALALVLTALAGHADAASFALVPTSASSTSHAYDVVLDTAGEPFGAFDLFLEAVQVSGTGLLSTTAQDFTAAAGGAVLGPGFETQFFPIFNGAHWGGLSSAGDLPPVAGIAIGSLTVNHTVLAPGAVLHVLTAAAPPSGLSNATGELPLELVLPLASIPEPALPFLLAPALALAASLPRRGPSRYRTR